MKKILLLLIFCASQGFGKTDNDTNHLVLYLLRHAKSSDADPSLQDFDRPLNDRGFADAPKMGKFLKKSGIKVDLVVASPSVRTTQTIQLIAPELSYAPEAIQWDSTIYRCSSTVLLRAIKNVTNNHRSVLFVGHNPAITQVANELQKDTAFQEVPTCGIVAIQFDTKEWSKISASNGKLLFFERPARN